MPMKYILHSQLSVCYFFVCLISISRRTQMKWKQHNIFCWGNRLRSTFEKFACLPNVKHSANANKYCFRNQDDSWVRPERFLGFNNSGAVSKPHSVSASINAYTFPCTTLKAVEPFGMSLGPATIILSWVPFLAVTPRAVQVTNGVRVINVALHWL